MAQILLINGANLNLLGTREPGVYGNTTLGEIEQKLASQAADLGHGFAACQSNAEADLVDRVQQASGNSDFIILNPGAFTHTSIAIRDALLAVDIPFIEVHISNVYAREEFRQHSYYSDIAVGTIVGLGPKGYELALIAADHFLHHQKTPA